MTCEHGRQIVICVISRFFQIFICRETPLSYTTPGYYLQMLTCCIFKRCQPFNNNIFCTVYMCYKAQISMTLSRPDVMPTPAERNKAMMISQGKWKMKTSIRCMFFVVREDSTTKRGIQCPTSENHLQRRRRNPTLWSLPEIIYPINENNS